MVVVSVSVGPADEAAPEEASPEEGECLCEKEEDDESPDHFNLPLLI